MAELIARSAQILVALAGAYLLALWFVLVVWTFRDIESRSRNVLTQVFSSLLVVLFFVPGVLLYLILRPTVTLDEAFQRSLEEEYLLQDLEELPLCPSCNRYVEDDYQLCPQCHAQLRAACAACARLVDLRWALCPYCATPQHGHDAEPAERVEAPAARWIAPGARRRRPEPSISPSEPTAPVSVPVPAPVPMLPPRAPDQVAAAQSSDDAETLQPAASIADSGPIQLPSSWRAIARPFDRFRARDTTNSESVSGFGRSAVQPLDHGVAAPPAAGGSPTVPRGRFRPVDPDANGRLTGYRDAEPNGLGAAVTNGHTAGNGHGAAATNGHDPTDPAPAAVLVKPLLLVGRDVGDHREPEPDTEPDARLATTFGKGD